MRIQLPARTGLSVAEDFALRLDAAKGDRTVEQSSLHAFRVVEEPPLDAEERAAVDALVAEFEAVLTEEGA